MPGDWRLELGILAAILAFAIILFAPKLLSFFS